MLNWILGASLRNKLVVLMVSFGIAVYGHYVMLRMPVDVLPDLNRPVVTILTEAHGLVPEDVELLVSWPIEQVMNGATGVYRVRSASGMGLSVVWVDFDWGTDIYRDRQVVAEKLQLAIPNLPPGIKPMMAPISSIMGQIQMVGFQSRSGKIDATELRRVIDRDIRPRIMSLSGIAQIVTIGGQPTELQVIVDTDKLRTFGVTLPELEDAVREANVNVAGGYLDIGTKGPLVTVPGLVRQARDLGQAIVRPDPIRPVRLEDVAKVMLGPAAIRTGDAGINGHPGVIMVIQKQPGEDTVKLTDRINAELIEIQKELSEDVLIVNDVFQQAAFIHRAVDNVLAAVRDGSILVVIVLFLFLLNLRTTIITLSAIPMSVAITAMVFAAFGLTINTMTLGGLAVAIGTLVDDAIVGVENVFRRLHENASTQRPRPVLSVVYSASSEVRKPVTYGTFLVCVVYLPLFALSGIEGRLFAPIGLAFVTSVLASLLVALTLTPVLCYYLLGMRSVQRREYGSWLVRHLKSAVAKVVGFSIARPVEILAVVLALVMVCLLILFTRGTTFLPEFNEGSAQVNLVLPPDTSLQTSNAFGHRLELVVRDVKGIQHVGRRTGRAAGDEHVMPVSATEAILTFDPDSDRGREEIIEEIRDRLDGEFPGVATSTEQPLAHLLSAVLSGVTAQVAIKVSGPDLGVLRRAAREIEALIRPLPGVRDLYVEPQVMIDQIEVKPRREALAMLGLNVEDVAKTIELAMGGEEISRMQMGQITYPIVVRLRAEDRKNLDNLRNLYLRRADGQLLLLADVADVRLTKTPNNINRENVQRRIVVQHNVSGRSLGEVVADVERGLEPVRSRLAGMPGYALRISGQFEAQQEATQLILVLSVVSVAGMLLILYLHFHSLTLAGLLLGSRPIAFIGAVAYVLATGQVLSVATLIGLIAVLGVAARNAILLIDRYLHLMRDEGVAFSQEMIIRAGQERVAPVMMTALTSSIGLVPLALAADQPGRELLYPVATVVIGGLISSTLLDFLVTPGLFWMFGRREAERLVAKSMETVDFVPSRPRDTVFPSEEER